MSDCEKRRDSPDNSDVTDTQFPHLKIANCFSTFLSDFLSKIVLSKIDF